MFEALLEQIAQGLDARRIPYMLIGGQAVLLYGEPRLTRDVDVTLGVGPDRLREILEWVRETQWRILVDSPAQFVTQTLVLPCLQEESGIRVDLIFSLSPYERQAIQRGRPITVGKTAVRYASVEDLVIHKVVAGRARDLEDVRSVLLKNPEMDADYTRKWLREIDADGEKKLLANFEELWKQRGKK
jgi:hypothetical protein